MEVIAFPDVEALVRQYLVDELPSYGFPGVGVSTLIPSNRTNDMTFVTIPRVGGPTRNLVVDQPTLSVSTWAPTNVQAFALARVVRALLGALPGRVLAEFQVYKVEEFTGPALLPDPESNHPRYMQAVSVSIRGSVLEPIEP